MKFQRPLIILSLFLCALTHAEDLQDTLESRLIKVETKMLETLINFKQIEESEPNGSSSKGLAEIYIERINGIRPLIADLKNLVSGDTSRGVENNKDFYIPFTIVYEIQAKEFDLLYQSLVARIRVFKMFDEVATESKPPANKEIVNRFQALVKDQRI